MQNHKPTPKISDRLFHFTHPKRVNLNTWLKKKTGYIKDTIYLWILTEARFQRWPFKASIRQNLRNAMQFDGVNTFCLGNKHPREMARFEPESFIAIKQTNICLHEWKMQTVEFQMIIIICGPKSVSSSFYLLLACLLSFVQINERWT